MGERIKLLRKGKFSQEELADLLDVHVNTLIKWEHDKGYPTADKLKVLAKTLGTTVAYILGETDDLTPLKVENDSRNDVDLPNEESPYVKEQQKLNKGMLVYTFKNGEKVEMPPIKASYDFLRDVALGVARVAVL
ncbi:MAG: helix-turn-helix transcriptional regulator [Synergistaceae bacterium]|nr:helix-turn-helix transcriptional regulator [Synergistaceae bacterium]